MSSYGSSLFASFQAPAPKRHWESFAFSYAVQIAALAALLLFSILAPRLGPPALIASVQLVAPDLTPPPAAQPVKPAPAPAAKLPPRRLPPVVAEKHAPRLTAPPVPELRDPQRLQRTAPVAAMPQPRLAAAPRFESKVLAALPAPRVAPRIVAVNTFAGSSAAPTLSRMAPEKVQTGGFGDPNGVRASAHGSIHSVISVAGAFDLPQGPGNGNGSGGARGARGTVASAGFGNGIAVTNRSGRRAAQAHPVAASFSNAAEAATTAGPHRNRHARGPARWVPVSILSKPTPVYTPEARALKIQGEVLLNVVFTADGKVKVLNVVRGLGHGLDQSARHAAEGIRFHPARRDGHPVDSNATLHIVFQLS